MLPPEKASRWPFRFSATSSPLSFRSPLSHPLPPSPPSENFPIRISPVYTAVAMSSQFAMVAPEPVEASDLRAKQVAKDGKTRIESGNGAARELGRKKRVGILSLVLHSCPRFLFVGCFL